MAEKNDSFVARKIRSEYEEKQTGKIEELKALDSKVKKPATVFGYVFGTVGALVMGSGMSLAMEVIGSMPIVGVLVGLVGILMVSVTYPIYKKILASRRKKYSDAIIKLSEEIINE